jgi:hypothetical protein
MLAFANLNYGRRAYEVLPNETLPLPQEFDFENAEACARKIFAIMSNASGGHLIKGCKVATNKVNGTANLTGNGVHVFYQIKKRPKVSLKTEEEVKQYAADIEANRVVLELGDVVTDQYGDGWTRAVWK